MQEIISSTNKGQCNLQPIHLVTYWHSSKSLKCYYLNPLYCNVQTSSGVQPACWGPSLVVKRPGHEFDHSPPSSAAIKNDQSYISTPPYGFIACTEVTATLPLQICVLWSKRGNATGNWRNPHNNERHNLYFNLSQRSKFREISLTDYRRDTKNITTRVSSKVI